MKLVSDKFLMKFQFIRLGNMAVLNFQHCAVWNMISYWLSGCRFLPILRRLLWIHGDPTLWTVTHEMHLKECHMYAHWWHYRRLACCIWLPHHCAVDMLPSGSPSSCLFPNLHPSINSWYKPSTFQTAVLKPKVGIQFCPFVFLVFQLLSNKLRDFHEMRHEH